jgi:hypothetical protein
MTRAFGKIDPDDVTSRALAMSVNLRNPSSVELILGETAKLRVAKRAVKRLHLCFNDLVAYRVTHQLTHAMQVQLAHDIGAVGVGCLNTDPE